MAYAASHRPYSFPLVMMFLVTTGYGYALSISRRDSTRSISGRIPSSLEIARDSSSRDMALARSLSASRSFSMSA